MNALVMKVLNRFCGRQPVAAEEEEEKPKLRSEAILQVYRGLETGAPSTARPQDEEEEASPKAGRLWLEIDTTVLRLFHELPEFYGSLRKWVTSLKEHYQEGVREELRKIDRIVSRLRDVLTRIGRAVHEMERVRRDVANEVKKLSSDYALPHFEALADAAFAEDWPRVHKILEHKWVETALEEMVRRVAQMLQAMSKAHKPLEVSARTMARRIERISKPFYTNPRTLLDEEVQRLISEARAKEPTVSGFVQHHYGSEKAGYGFLTPQYDQVSGRWVHSEGKSLEEIVQGYAPMLLKIPGVVAVAPGRSKKTREPVVVVYLTHTGLSDIIPVKVEGYKVRTMSVDDLAPTKKESVRPVPFVHKGDVMVYEHNILTNPTVWGWWRRAPFRDPTQERAQDGILRGRDENEA